MRDYATINQIAIQTDESVGRRNGKSQIVKIISIYNV
jgi:hypothetical protein